MQEKRYKNIIVLIAGGHAAGKRTTANLLKEEIPVTFPLSNLEVEIIDLNDYNDELIDIIDKPEDEMISKFSAISVKNLSENIKEPSKPSRFNFEKLRDKLNQNLFPEQGHPQKIFLIHGLYALYNKELRDMSEIKVFITVDPDTRLIRWIQRDVLYNPQKSISLENVISAYLQKARGEMSDFIFPTKEFADVIMPRGAESNAVKLIVDGIIPYLPKNSHPDKMYLRQTTENYLRPGANGIFDKEKFDAQKGKFYELN